MTTVRMTDDPQNRLTRIAGIAVDAVDGHAEAHPEDQVIVLIRRHRDGGWDNGVCMSGFSSADELAGALLMFAKAMLESHGGQLNVVPVMQN